MRYWKNEIGFSRMSYEDLFNIFGEKLFNIIRPQILNRDTNFRIIISVKERLLQIIGQIMLCKKNKITCLHWQIGQKCICCFSNEHCSLFTDQFTILLAVEMFISDHIS